MTSRKPSRPTPKRRAITEADHDAFDEVLLPKRPPRRRAVQDRAVRSVQAAIDATVELLETRGEAGVRIADIAQRSGLSHGAIYHHFGDRDGLIQAAQFARLSNQPAADIRALREAAEAATSREEFLDLIGLIAVAIASPDRAQVRLVRASVITAASHRPELEMALRQLESEIAEDLIEVLELAAERGWLAPDIDPVAAAAVLEAISFGLILQEFIERSPDEQSLASTLGFIFASMAGSGPAARRRTG